MTVSQACLSFKEFLQLFPKDVIRADTSMQIRQRHAWMELNRGFPVVEGLNQSDSMEFVKGLDRSENLGLTEVTLTYWLEPVRLSWWVCLWRWLRYPFGASGPVPHRFRLVPPGGRGGRVSIEVAITAGRDYDSG